MLDVPHLTKRPWLDAWSQALVTRTFRIEVILTAGALLLVLSSLSRFLDIIELRHGVILSDPFLSLCTPHDLTWLTFSIIYLGLLLAIATLSYEPEQLLVALQSYVVLACMRMVCMYVVPLDPPVGMIPLQDPFVQYFGTGKLLTRDLFFSGHTSTMCLLFLTTSRRSLRGIFLVSTIVVGVCVLWQHVHYSIDVLAAPPFAYVSYRFVVLTRRRLHVW
jgi:hypothetical protein